MQQPQQPYGVTQPFGYPTGYGQPMGMSGPRYDGAEYGPEGDEEPPFIPDDGMNADMELNDIPDEG